MRHAMNLWLVGLMAFTLAFLAACSIQKAQLSTHNSLGKEAEYPMAAPMEEMAVKPAMPASPGRANMADEGALAGSSAPEQAMDNTMATAHAAQATQLLQPQIIKTGTVSLKVDDIEKSMTALEALTRSYQGTITNQYIALAGEQASYRNGTLEVRVPQAKLDAFLADLAKLGTMMSKQVTGTDVGAEMVDTEARIRNLKAEEAALQAIMQRAGKIPEVLEVARELSRVRGNIEQAQGRLNHLRQQVAYSTVNITLSETGVSGPTETKPGIGSTIVNAFNKALGALYDLFLWLLEVVIWSLVYIIPLLALVALVVRLLWKVLVKVLAALLKQSTLWWDKLKPRK